MSAAGVGKPGRHNAALHGDTYRLRPGACLAISHQGKRRDLSRTVARLAVSLKNGKNVAVEARPWLGGVKQCQGDDEKKAACHYRSQWLSLQLRFPQPPGRGLWRHRRVIDLFEGVGLGLGGEDWQDLEMPVVVVVEGLPVSQAG